MNIALIAHDAKKELMVQFCIAYCGILSRHNLCATGTTGKIVSETTGLKIVKYLSGSQGGGQQIKAKIGCDEVERYGFAQNLRYAQYSRCYKYRNSRGSHSRFGAW